MKYGDFIFNPSINQLKNEYKSHRNEKTAGENSYCIWITQKIHESKENGFFVHKFSVSDILPILFFLKKIKKYQGTKESRICIIFGILSKTLKCIA